MLRTVLGPVAAANAGLVQAHEHLLARPPAPYDSDLDLVLDSEEAAAQELRWFKDCGGGTIVEASPPDYGRDIVALARLSRATGIHVIACTGRHKAIYAQYHTPRATVEELTEEFVSDITAGSNGIRAGVIKVASSAVEIAPIERTALLAAARASVATDAAITTHLQDGRLGLEQLAVLREGGADPRKIIVGHADRLIDTDYHESILRQGVYLQFDQVGHSKYGTDSERAQAIVELCRRGYGSRMCVSSDLGRRSYLRAYGGSPGLGHVLNSFLAELGLHGLSRDEALAMVTTNPYQPLDIRD